MKLLSVMGSSIRSLNRFLTRADAVAMVESATAETNCRRATHRSVVALAAALTVASALATVPAPGPGVTDSVASTAAPLQSMSAPDRLNGSQPVPRIALQDTQVAPAAASTAVVKGQSKTAAAAPYESDVPFLRSWMLAVLGLLVVALAAGVKITLTYAQRSDHSFHAG